ncbi:hypothetical protein BGZ51_005009 [Haplosporangium sp. Z 767]|nr:hypothetical protein BGZ51_005009 [Haplosporangium sp. Z 767]KAF9182314.1 hypothetical protein BGZ50_004990 [Haplosporangium sp. Z 11]
MKFLYALALLVTMTVVSVQGQTNGAAACTICLQNSIQALPLCSGLNITMGDFNPSENPAYAKCLCSSLDGAWIDACTGKDQCGQDIVSFKNAYAGNIQAAGLSCGPTPTFAPKSP